MLFTIPITWSYWIRYIYNTCLSMLPEISS
nr:MAG TPA: hypothetical protein [Bacteriophage sp.]